MSKKDQNSFSNILSINPYDSTCFNGISSFLKKEKSPQYDKKQFAISYLDTKNFINTQIDISKNIPEEDLYDAINNKIYDELALDQALTYQIQFIETFNNLDEDNRHFHVFVIDPLTISETFENIIKKIKYLDVIVPSPLLLKSLYTKEIIEDNGIHCFIYIQENDTFITIYNEKEFIYTKSINYSFKQMHERFCELYGEQIEYDDFIRFFQNENLKETTSDYKEYFIKLYKEIFANINDILTYVKRAFDINKIQQIYIGSQISTITKLDEMAEAELSIKSSNFEFDYGLESDGNYIDQIHSLMHIYATLEANEKYDCNFTVYHRPAKFIQRQSGKLILFSIAALVIAFIYPVTYWVLTYAQAIQHDLLKQKYSQIHNTKTTREAIIKNKEADKEKVLTILSQNKQEYHEKKSTLAKIHDVKVNYPMKAKLLTTLTKDLNTYNIQLENISYGEDKEKKNFNLKLISSKDKKITRLLEYLTKTYENKFHFSLEEILYNKKKKKYFSELKVEIL